MFRQIDKYKTAVIKIPSLSDWKTNASKKPVNSRDFVLIWRISLPLIDVYKQKKKKATKICFKPAVFQKPLIDKYIDTEQCNEAKSVRPNVGV
jgi:hypothetical protein